jgi:hypothetical protein
MSGGQALRGRGDHKDPLMLIQEGLTDGINEAFIGGNNERLNPRLTLPAIGHRADESATREKNGISKYQCLVKGRPVTSPATATNINSTILVNLVHYSIVDNK